MRVFTEKFDAKFFSVAIFRIYRKISVLRKKMFITLAPGGKVKVTMSVDLGKPIEAGAKVSVKVKKNVFGFNIAVPCTEVSSFCLTKSVQAPLSGPNPTNFKLLKTLSFRNGKFYLLQRQQYWEKKLPKFRSQLHQNTKKLSLFSNPFLVRSNNKYL